MGMGSNVESIKRYQVLKVVFLGIVCFLNWGTFFMLLLNSEKKEREKQHLAELTSRPTAQF